MLDLFSWLKLCTLILLSDQPDETIIKTEHLQDEEESNMNFVVNDLESSVTGSEAPIKTTSESQIMAKENVENTSFEEDPQPMCITFFRCPMCDQKYPQKSMVEKHIIGHHKIDIGTLKVSNFIT